MIQRFEPEADEDESGDPILPRMVEYPDGDWVCFADYARENQRLRGLLKAAKCPNGGCDGEGHIGHDTGEMIDWEPCHWCHEREEATRSGE
jgi:hypothetical protein